MEIITGYFSSKDRAVEAAETLRNRGFKGEISVIGRHNEEDFRGKARSDTDDISGEYDYGITALSGGLAGVPAAAFMIQGSGSFSAALPIAGLIGNYGGELTRTLTHWGVPKKESEEIKGVIESGNTVILIESEENEKLFVRDILQNKGAQNIHI